MSEMSIGMIGLGVMGRNLPLNIEEKGFSVAAWDAWPEPVDSFVAASQGKRIEGFHELSDFVKSLRKPRRIIMLAPLTQSALCASTRGFGATIQRWSSFETSPRRRPRSIAVVDSRNCPPSEKLSGVAFTIPITSGRWANSITRFRRCQ